MKKIKFIAVILAALAFTFQACTTEDPDTEPPVIEVQSPADHEHFHAGDVITFEATFTDNIALSQFKIDIHFGEGHDHKSANHDDDEIEWHFEYIGDLSGTSQQVSMDIPIPHNAKHGEYHFMVFCTDEAGNESLVNLEIEVEDDDHDH
jgi:hypothetical protein